MKRTWISQGRRAARLGAWVVAAYFLSVGPVYKLAAIADAGAEGYQQLNCLYQPVFALAETPLSDFVAGYVRLFGLEFASSCNYSTPEPDEITEWFVYPPL